MAKKLRMAVLCGGMSGEHEVSLRSAHSVIASADKKKYEIKVLGIDKKGFLWLYEPDAFLLNPDNPKKCCLSNSTTGLAVIPSKGKRSFFHYSSTNFFFLSELNIDVVFPIIHGPYGEDGCVQGLLEMLQIPYVGSDVLGSAVSMDKEITKKVAKASNLAVVPWVSFNDGEWKKKKNPLLRECEALGLPLFVKPANLGSSVGISKVEKKAHLPKAIQSAFAYDRKVIVEKGLDAREIEVALLGNEDPIASVPGEIIVHDGFYSYEAKYLDDSKSEVVAPAKLTDMQTEKVKDLAVQAFKALCCTGMARADFLLQKGTGKFFFNELNSIPGFTAISLYPVLWELSGISRPELIDRLVDLAFDRFKNRV